MKLILAKLTGIIPSLILIALFSSVVALRYKSSFSRKYSAGTVVRLTGQLPEVPYQTRSSQLFHLHGFTILARKFPTYNYGDRVVVEGELQSRSGREPAGMLKEQSVNFWLVYPDISVLGQGEYSGLDKEPAILKAGKKLVSFRLQLLRVFRELLPQPHGSLLAGIVFGERGQMGEEFYDQLRETGVLHVIAASGMNVTIIAGVLITMLLRVFTRRVAVIGAIIGILFYALLAGGSAPVVRAAIMGSVTYLAAFLGREKDGGIALIVAAGGMLVWNPLYLMDVGWQLSFAATVGILYGYPVLDKFFSRVLAWLPLEIGSELAVTLAAQLATLPLIVFHFGRLSLISPVVNVLVAPVVPVLMIWGGVMAVAGLVWKGLAQVIGWGAWVFLEYFVRVVEVFGSTYKNLSTIRKVHQPASTIGSA